MRRRGSCQLFAALMWLLVLVKAGVLLAADISVPEGFTVELAAGPPLVTHPTLGCFDEQGRLYVCNNAGVNMTNEELEQHLPNSIVRLVDRDGDGRFDSSTVFADKMTFPMGGTWHDGALYVASPPNIWRLRDTDDDGIADEREVLVSQFGYNGNAASIHGCFRGPDGRIYWTDGFHGHEIKDAQGNITSTREGSYIFSCTSDGADVRIHCGGGMDNPVEIDFTDSGDMLGTVNILYTRPRVDCLVHWLHGGVYPHREKVLDEVLVTGEFLGPAHSFGHVAVSGFTRYRSGYLNSAWNNDSFATFFNGGKVVRLRAHREGSSYGFTQHEFLTSTSRDFHPTDVLEDADGSLLVIDTGGWFYRGCPTSQLAKPELLGGIYRIRRADASHQPHQAEATIDPRGMRINWSTLTSSELKALLDDPRFAVRERAIEHCASSGEKYLGDLEDWLRAGNRQQQIGAVWALARLVQNNEWAVAAATALATALDSQLAEVRQAACLALGNSSQPLPTELVDRVILLLRDTDAAVRRQAATTLGRQPGQPQVVAPLVAGLTASEIDRPEQHALIYALLELDNADTLRQAVGDLSSEAIDPRLWQAAIIALDQIQGGELQWREVERGWHFADPAAHKTAYEIAKRHPQWTPSLAKRLSHWLETDSLPSRGESLEALLASLLHDPDLAAAAGEYLNTQRPREDQEFILRAIARAKGISAAEPSWVVAIQEMLQQAEPERALSAVAAAAALPSPELAAALKSLSEDPSQPLPLQIAALEARARRAGKLDDTMLERLIHVYLEAASPTASARAVQLIGQSALTQGQLVRVLPLLERASPVDLRELLSGFQRSLPIDVARQFLTTIARAEHFSTLAEHEFSDVIKRFPPELLDTANDLLDILKEAQQIKLARLEKLRERLELGNAERGELVFKSERAKCQTCHRVGEQGIRVGPDLTTIGANRAAGDLLESIVLPSASLVRDYEAYKILTAGGSVLTGLIAKETADAIHLQQATGEIMALPRSEIEQVLPSGISLMPAGIDEALSAQDIADLVSYLRTLR